MKSRITTQEAQALIDKGYELISAKITGYKSHYYYIRPSEKINGRYWPCKYINKKVFDNLVKNGNPFIEFDYNVNIQLAEENNNV